MSTLSDLETRYINYQRSHNNAAYWEAVALVTMVVLCIIFSLLP